jgi:hypothetical protein
MESKERVVLNVVLDARILLAIALVVIIGAVAVVTAGAQGPATANEEVAPSDEAAPKPAASSSSTAAQAQGFVTLRSFYLTEANYNADEVLSACARGYHMASLWEILDVSNLAYAYDHPDAHTKDDSGQGPPSHWYGWVRTGWNTSSTDTAGVGNCQNWTSIDSADQGSIVRLTYDWATAPTAVGPWETLAFNCIGFAPVWCVED